MDGDIEIVPFSSFAMLRHMEDWGRELGAVGPQFLGRTNDRRKVTPCLYMTEPPSNDMARLSKAAPRWS